jgi:hypothetical protein
MTTRLPLHRSRMEHRRIYHELHQSTHDVQKSITVKKDIYVINSQIIYYILNILICVNII